MALQSILLAIEQEGAAEEARLMEAAEAEARALLERARQEAAGLEERRSIARREGSRAAAARLLHAAQLAARSELRQAREEVVQEALAEARAGLEALHRGGGWPRTLRALLEEALRAVPDAVLVQVEARDAALTAELLDALHHRARVEEHPDAAGGVIVRGAEGRCLRNLLQERLERAEPWVRQAAARRLLAPSGGDAPA